MKESKEDPEAAIQNALPFLRANAGTSQRTRSWLAKLYKNVALAQAVKLRDANLALTTIDEAIAALGDKPPTPDFFIVTKSELLMRAGRLPEAEALLASSFRAFAPKDPAAAIELLPKYARVLDEQNRSAEALEIVQQFVVEHPEQWNDLNLIETMVKRLTVSKRPDEALSWGRLYFMLVPYEEEGLADATRMLLTLWTTKYLTPVKAQELVAAMQDESTPNPLRAIPLPAAERAVMQKQAVSARKPADRISYLLLSGDDRAAMLEAQKLVLSDPTSPKGALEVARVFKAHDLNVKRANAFLDYYNKGEGENPVTAFFQEK